MTVTERQLLAAVYSFAICIDVSNKYFKDALASQEMKFTCSSCVCTTAPLQCCLR